MPLIFLFFLFFVIFAGLELYSISWVADRIGFFSTLIIVIGTGLAGAFIARENARDALQNLMRGDFRSGPPARQMFDAVVFFAAALLLIIPGLITDAAGLILLIPAVRTLIYNRLRSKAEVTFRQASSSPPPQSNSPGGKIGDTTSSDDIIDIEAEEEN